MERRREGRRREDRERARLVDQIVTAEQEERRRLADYLHDTAVQSLSAIAMLLEAGLRAVEAGSAGEGEELIAKALERQRATIRSLRDLSFNLEPVVLRDQGFVPAVKALTEQLGLEHKIAFEVNVDAAEALDEKVQAALYQIIREALQGSVRRGPPERVSVRIVDAPDGGVEAVIADDARGERRLRTFDAIEERARTLSGRLAVDAGADGGTTVRVTLPSYVVRD